MKQSVHFNNFQLKSNILLMPRLQPPKTLFRCFTQDICWVSVLCVGLTPYESHPKPLLLILKHHFIANNEGLTTSHLSTVSLLTAKL